MGRGLSNLAGSSPRRTRSSMSRSLLRRRHRCSGRPACCNEAAMRLMRLGIHDRQSMAAPCTSVSGQPVAGAFLPWTSSSHRSQSQRCEVDGSRAAGGVLHESRENTMRWKVPNSAFWSSSESQSDAVALIAVTHMHSVSHRALR